MLPAWAVITAFVEKFPVFTPNLHQAPTGSISAYALYEVKSFTSTKLVSRGSAAPTALWAVTVEPAVPVIWKSNPAPAGTNKGTVKVFCAEIVVGPITIAVLSGMFIPIILV